jgi:hypothetical protein
LLAYVGIRNLLAPLVALPLLALFFDDTSRQSLNGWVASLILDTGGGVRSQTAWAILKTLAFLTVAWAFTTRRITRRA